MLINLETYSNKHCTSIGLQTPYLAIYDHVNKYSQLRVYYTCCPRFDYKFSCTYVSEVYTTYVTEI